MLGVSGAWAASVQAMSSSICGVSASRSPGGMQGVVEPRRSDRLQGRARTLQGWPSRGLVRELHDWLLAFGSGASRSVGPSCRGRDRQGWISACRGRYRRHDLEGLPCGAASTDAATGSVQPRKWKRERRAAERLSWMFPAFWFNVLSPTVRRRAVCGGRCLRDNGAATVQRGAGLHRQRHGRNFGRPPRRHPGRFGRGRDLFGNRRGNTGGLARGRFRRRRRLRRGTFGIWDLRIAH